MNISERQENDITIYIVDGRIDSEGAIKLDEVLHAGLNNSKYKLVLEMSQVQYINSAALRTLADVITISKEHGGDLKLVALQPKVKRVLQIVGFDKFSSIHDTVATAVAEF